MEGFVNSSFHGTTTLGCMSRDMPRFAALAGRLPVGPTPAAAQRQPGTPRRRRTAAPPLNAAKTASLFREEGRCFRGDTAPHSVFFQHACVRQIDGHLAALGADGHAGFADPAAEELAGILGQDNAVAGALHPDVTVFLHFAAAAQTGSHNGSPFHISLL